MRPIAVEQAFGPAQQWYTAGMKPKTVFYAGLGFVTYKAGKILAKRKVREALQAPKSDKGK